MSPGQQATMAHAGAGIVSSASRYAHTFSGTRCPPPPPPPAHAPRRGRNRLARRQSRWLPRVAACRGVVLSAFFSLGSASASVVAACHLAAQDMIKHSGAK